MRPRQLTGVDQPFQVQVSVGFYTPSGTQSSDATCQVEARRGKAHLRRDGRLLPIPVGIEIRTCKVKHVVVHAYNARHDGISVQVEYDSPRCCGDIGACLYRADLSAFDNDVLIFNWGVAGAIDDADMSKDHSG